MDEIRIFGYCECCGNTITDEGEAYFTNDEGEVFCSAECVLEHYDIIKVEI